MNGRTWGRWLYAAGMVVILSATTGLAAESPTVLFVGGEDNYVASGLRALQVPFDEASVRELLDGDICLFDYGAIVFGMDEKRAGLTAIKDAVAAFAEVGGVVLCFRSSDSDPWLPCANRKRSSLQAR